MSVTLWPENVAPILEGVFGKGSVKPPLSFNGGKKGPGYFEISCRDKSKVETVREALKGIGIPRHFHINFYHDKPLNANLGILKLHIPANLAEKFSVAITANREKSKPF